MLKIPTIPLEKMPMERQLTLNIKKEIEKPKMRINPNIPMENLLKQHPKVDKLLKIKTKTSGTDTSEKVSKVSISSDLEKVEKVAEVEEKDISGNVA